MPAQLSAQLSNIYSRHFLPCAKLTLIFPISTLHLLVHILLYLALQHPRARRLVKVGDFQYVRGIDPVVHTPAHDMVSLDIEFVYRDLRYSQR